ncbi:hypothetical protein PMI10_02276 [Flavobacterium sp. CF136]|nr:hypothetical protein PMI10_02276 [Flavobacterium sp. CF136]
MKNKAINSLKNIKLFLLLFLLVVVVGAHAQPPPPFTDDVDDVGNVPPAVPVDDWIIPVIILGSILGCYIIRKSTRENNIN